MGVAVTFELTVELLQPWGRSPGCCSDLRADCGAVATFVSRPQVLLKPVKLLHDRVCFVKLPFGCSLAGSSVLVAP